MDSQLAYPRGDEYEKAPPTVGLHKEVEGGENEELSPSPSPPPLQQGKKSVLKKVKAKAKKLKDTLTKQSNSHGHGNSSGDHVPDDHGLDEEDDADEEMEELDQRTELPVKYGSDHERVGNVKFSESEAVGLEDDPKAPMDPSDSDRKPTHQVKVADPAGQGSIEETGVNPLISSFEKMNVKTDPEPELQFADSQSGSHDESFMSPGKNQSSYTQKISAATSAITDRAISAKNMVAFKLGYGEKDNQVETTQEENPASSGGYGNTFSFATSAIADKAVSAKNVVASKLGYGEKEPERETTEVEGAKETSSSPVEYGRKVVNTVYEKVAGAGTTAASKMRGTTGGAEKEAWPAEEENKGGSVKDYLSEILKPREEDKALSEIISGALHKSKEENDPVTESEEVKKRLGEEGEGSGSGIGIGKGMVGKIKDAVGSWMGRSGSDHQVSPRANPSPQGVEDIADSGSREKNPTEEMEKDGEEDSHRSVLQLQESTN